MATQYGYWLFANYAALLSHGGILTNRAVRGGVADLLAAPNSRVLWLIIDGFPAAYLPLLHEALTRHGLHAVRTDYALAPLPTITEIGIPPLLNGLRPDDPAFTTDRAEALRRAFPHKSVAFAAVVGRFAEALATETDLCCLHWTDLDEYQHRPEYKIEGTRTKHIRQAHLPRMSVDTLSKGIGLKADYPGESFHALRFRLEYDEFVE